MVARGAEGKQGGSVGDLGGQKTVDALEAGQICPVDLASRSSPQASSVSAALQVYNALTAACVHKVYA